MIALILSLSMRPYENSDRCDIMLDGWRSSCRLSIKKEYQENLPHSAADTLQVYTTKDIKKVLILHELGSMDYALFFPKSQRDFTYSTN